MKTEPSTQPSVARQIIEAAKEIGFHQWTSDMYPDEHGLAVRARTGFLPIVAQSCDEPSIARYIALCSPANMEAIFDEHASELRAAVESKARLEFVVRQLVINHDTTRDRLFTKDGRQCPDSDLIQQARAALQPSGESK